MGRKIPGRKHRGVRDPEKQRQIKLNRLKNKINTPPIDVDEQHIPRSLARVIELKNKVKSGVFSLKNKINTNQSANAKRGPNENMHKNIPAPVFTQGEGESNKNFLHRVDRICREVIKETEFEEKYGVEINRNSLTGEIEQVIKRKKDELEEYVDKIKQANKKKGKKKKKKEKDNDTPKLTKSQKRSIKLKAKKETKINNAIEYETCPDNIAFGEVVHAPPTLTAPRRVQAKNSASRPGMKDLLLKSVIAQNKESKATTMINKSVDKQKKIINKTIDKKGKRKDLPNALRRQLDRQQSEIIQAYKALKKQKYK